MDHGAGNFRHDGANIAVHHALYGVEIVERAVAETAGQRLKALLVFRLRRGGDGGSSGRDGGARILPDWRTGVILAPCHAGLV